MEGFTIVDAVVAGVIVISAILAYSRGFVRESLSIVGWIAAAFLAFTFAGSAKPLIQEIPYVGDFIGESCELAVIVAFAAVFALALVVVSLFTPLFSAAIRNSAIGGLDQGFGFIFGVVRGMLLVAVAFVVYERITSDGGIPMVEESRSSTIFARAQQQIEENIPADAPDWIVSRYETLVGHCSVPTEAATDATSDS